MNPPTEPQLRAPQPEDYAAIAGWVPDAEAALRWAGPLVRWPFSAEMLPALLVAPKACSRVLAADDGTPQGFCQYWPRDDGAVHLARILLAPGLRGQGLGGRLLQLLIDEARQATGATRLTLRVYRDNAAALALYTSRGFVPVPELSDPEVLFMHLDNLSASEDK